MKIVTPESNNTWTDILFFFRTNQIVPVYKQIICYLFLHPADLRGPQARVKSVKQNF